MENDKLKTNLCKFNEDIINLIVEKYKHNKALLVFPTEVSARTCQFKLQEYWEFNNIRAVGMDEFKKTFFLSDTPELADQKRYLAFFASLLPEYKVDFHIHNYFESVSLANNFFSFFEELREECVDINSVMVSLNDKSIETSPWQITNLERLLEIRESYRKFLDDRKLTDKIFKTQPEFQTEISEYDTIVFANQIYYTGIEKQLINLVQTEGIAVDIYFLGDKGEFNQEHNLAEKFDYIQHLKDTKINIRILENEHSMLLALCNDIHGEEKPQHYIYQGMGDSRAIEMLNPEIFSQPMNSSFEHSSIYKLLSIIALLLKGIVRDGALELISINAIMDALNESAYMKFLKLDDLKLKDAITKLIDNGFIYLDFELANCSKFIKNEYLLEFLKTQRDLLNQFKSIRCPEELIVLLSETINPQSLISESDVATSDTLSVFYEGLVNFRTLGEFPIFNKWSQLTDGDKQRLPKDILALLLENLSSRKVKYNIEKSGKKETSLSYHNFLDTRNLKYNNLAILNLLEGMLPGKRRQPYLFTEVQRKAIGLKTYEQIRQREKYYFFRLLSSAENVWLYGLNNDSGDFELSSYLEEIILAGLPNVHIEKYNEDAVNSVVLNSILKSDASWKISDEPITPGFSTIDYELADLPIKDGKMVLSFSRFKNLRENPFKFYLENIAGLRELKRRAEESFTARLFGTFVHNLMSEIVERLNETYENSVEQELDWLSEAYVESNLKSLLNSKKKEYYYLPKSLGKVYFDSIVRKAIVNNILSFFISLDEKKGVFQKKGFTFIPEAEDRSDVVYGNTPLVEFDKDGNKFGLYILAKADLRLVSNQEYIIIDYKTGRHHAILDYQLLMYEKVYREVDKITDKAVTPMFWMFKHSKFEKARNKKVGLADYITDAFYKVFENGFMIDRIAAYEQENIEDVSRFSYTQKVKGGSDAE